MAPTLWQALSGGPRNDIDATASRNSMKHMNAYPNRRRAIHWWSTERDMGISFCCLVLTSLLLLVNSLRAESQPAKGPLRVCQPNPRYFADSTGKAVYLTGSHTWNNLQDMGPT